MAVIVSQTDNDGELLLSSSNLHLDFGQEFTLPYDCHITSVEYTITTAPAVTMHDTQVYLKDPDDNIRCAWDTPAVHTVGTHTLDTTTPTLGYVGEVWQLYFSFESTTTAFTTGFSHGNDADAVGRIILDYGTGAVRGDALVFSISGVMARICSA